MLVSQSSVYVPQSAITTRVDMTERPPDRKLCKRRLTVCVVGSGGVGKSSLTIRYLHGHFPEVSPGGFTVHGF